MHSLKFNFERFERMAFITPFQKFASTVRDTHDLAATLSEMIPYLFRLKGNSGQKIIFLKRPNFVSDGHTDLKNHKIPYFSELQIKITLHEYHEIG